MRERLSLDQNWRFTLGHAASEVFDYQFKHSRCTVKAGEGRGGASPAFDDSNWKKIRIPHDWAIELPIVNYNEREFSDHGFRALGPDYPENSIGWYRKSFEIPESDLGRRISIEFDGVNRDCNVWINGHRLGNHASGFTAFRFDVTDFLNYRGKNVISVRVDASSWEGWWYEGAGIYRHVWLVKTDPLHVASNGTHIISEVNGTDAAVTIRTTVNNHSDQDETFVLKSVVGEFKAESSQTIPAWKSKEVVHNINIPSAKLWSCESPNLYSLKTSIDGRDEYQTTFGIRTLRWDVNEGFFLNGKNVKIKGTCNHQQHAGLGIALPDAIHRWKLEKLLEMGSNAYRCSHYAVSKELLDECDRLGILVMAENRLGGGGEEFCGQLRDQILRDRNHPSIIMWSLANEEHTVQWSITGERIGKTMVRLCHELDPTRAVTSAMHDRGFNEGFMKVVDVHGWNYISVGDITGWRERNPQQPIIGSEESSTVQDRGVYEDDPKRGYVRAYDQKTPKWGSTAEKWWTFFDERPWLAGGFVWTGYDYYGEPIPYKWPCTASHFGLMDLCGFRKDQFYYYQAWWSNQPTLHLFPHWNWEGKEDQEIDVHAYANCQSVELFLNGQSLGKQDVKRNSHLEWKVKYQPGTLEARGFTGGKQVLTTQIVTTGKSESIKITTSKPKLNADADDIVLVSIETIDSQGRHVPTADHLIHFELTGPANLIGVGNGDPSSHESDKAPQRKLFSGYAQAIIQSTNEKGKISFTAKSGQLKSASIQLESI